MRRHLTFSVALVFASVLLPLSTLTAAAPPRSSFVIGGKRVRVERFVPKGDGKFPAVVLLHGLDGMEANGTIYRQLARTLAEKGYVAVLVHYFDRTATTKEQLPALMKQFRAFLDNSKAQDKDSLALRANFADWMETVKAAIADTRQHVRVDADRVGLVGLSLGGFLATATATQQSVKIRCVADLFGGLPASLADQSKHMPPALIIHGDHDDIVPLNQAKSLHDWLCKAKRQVDIKVYSKVGHCFFDRDGGFAWWPALDARIRTLAFLANHLQLPKPRVEPASDR